MVEVKFTYPEGYKSKRLRTEFEDIAKERIGEFFNDKKVQDFLKEPMTLELIISRNNEITPTLPNGEVFVKTVEQICAEFDELIRQLRELNK